MTDHELKVQLLRGAARSMEAEGADYDRVLKRMLDRLDVLEKKREKEQKKDKKS